MVTDKFGAEPTTAAGTRNAVAARSLSIVICSYTTRRWADLCRVVDSVLDQDGPTIEIIVVIDHCDDLYLLACHRYRAMKRVTVCWNTFDPGLSGARNSGVAAARGDVIAFIDDDAEAEPGWVRALMSHFTRDEVACVGGYAIPVWPEGRPVWMPEEFDWVVGCSYVGQPTEVAPVRNPLGCNMSLRRNVFGTVGEFKSELGRVGTTPVGGEETELCIRIRTHEPSKQVLFDPEIRVRHHISPDRATLRYFTHRCYHEGISKAVLTEFAEGKALSTERAYVFRVLPRAVLREVSSMSRDGFARAGVIILGLALTTSGYLRATLSRRFRARRTP